MTDIQEYWDAKRLIGHYFPLRPGVDVYLALPRNLTAAEAARLERFVHAIAFDDPPLGCEPSQPAEPVQPNPSGRLEPTAEDAE